MSLSLTQEWLSLTQICSRQDPKLTLQTKAARKTVHLLQQDLQSHKCPAQGQACGKWDGKILRTVLCLVYFFRPRPLRHCTFTRKVGNLHSVPRPAASLLSQLHLQDPTSRIQVAQLTPHTEGRAARDSATQLLSLDVGFTVLKAFGFLLDFATNDLASCCAQSLCGKLCAGRAFEHHSILRRTAKIQGAFEKKWQMQAAIAHGQG